MSKEFFGFEENIFYYNFIEIRKTCLGISNFNYVSSIELGYQVSNMSSFSSYPNLHQPTQFVRISPEILQIPVFEYLFIYPNSGLDSLDGAPNGLKTQ